MKTANTGRRFLSVILVIMMMVGMMPAHLVFADGEVETVAISEPTHAPAPDAEPTRNAESVPTTAPTENPQAAEPTAAPTAQPQETDPTAMPTEKPQETEPTTAPTEEPQETGNASTPEPEPQPEPEPEPEPETFGNSITGIVWLDENSDGRMNKGEKRLSDMRVLLCGNESVNAAIAQVRTDAKGKYALENVESGTYYITVSEATDARLPKIGVARDNTVRDNGFTAPIQMDGESVIPNINVGMLPPAQPSDDELITPPAPAPEQDGQDVQPEGAPKPEPEDDSGNGEPGEGDQVEQGEQPDGGDEAGEGDQSDEGELPDELEEAIYNNSISGMLWLDMLEDIDSSLYGGDGIRQAEELPIAGYPVILYKAGDTSTVVQTTSSGSNGIYRFENIEPGSYVVGVKANMLGIDEYLLPMGGINGDNKFAIDTSEWICAYTVHIEISEDIVVTGMDAGMRTPPEATPRTTGTGVGRIQYYGQLVNPLGDPITGYTIPYSANYTSGNPTVVFNSWTSVEYVTTDSNGQFYVDTGIMSSYVIDGNRIHYAVPFRLHFGFQNVSTVAISDAAITSLTGNTSVGANTASNGNMSFVTGSNPITGYSLIFAACVAPVVQYSGEVIVNSNSSPAIWTLGNAYRITENYLSTTGATLQTSTTQGKIDGQAYTKNPSITLTDSGAIYTYAGYRIDTVTGPLNPGTSSFTVSANATVNYYYALDSTDLTVICQYESGGVASAPVTDNFQTSITPAYNTSAATVPGYAVSRVTVKVNGGTETEVVNASGGAITGYQLSPVLGDTEIEVTYYYDKDTDSDGIPDYAITEKYHKDQSGTVIDLTLYPDIVSGAIPYGDPYILNGAQSVTGYIYQGYIDPAGTFHGSAATPTDPTNVTSDATYIYVYQANNYGVTYQYNYTGSPSGDIYNTTTADYDSTLIAPAAPTRTGYTFDGWYKEAACTNAWSFSTDKVAGGTVLYARWTVKGGYTVNYDTDGGSTVAAKTPVLWSDTGLLPSTTPTKSGYTLTGWTVSVGGSGSATAASSYGSLATNDATMSITLKAQWTVKGGYTVNYDTDGGSAVAAKPPVLWTDTGLLPASAPTKNGYTLTDWIVSVGGSGSATATSTYGSLATNDATTAITLKAVWTAKTGNTVNYNMDGGLPQETTRTNVSWTDANLTPTSPPTKSGYNFTGWQCGGTNVTSASTYGDLAVSDTVTSITLTAQWTVKSGFTVNYDTDGGTPASITAKSGVLWTDSGLLPAPAPTKNGYNLTGWTVSAGGSGAATATSTYGSLATNDTTMAITLKAVWTPIKYPVNVNYETRSGGAVTGKTNTSTNEDYSSAYALTTTHTAAPIGYAYAGWKLNGGAIQSGTPSITVPLNGATITLVYGYDRGTTGDDPGNPTGPDSIEDIVITKEYEYNSASIKTTEQVLANVGGNFTDAAPGITGYTYDHYEVGGAPSAQFAVPNIPVAAGDSDFTVTYVYTLNSYAVTVNYEDRQGQPVGTPSTTSFNKDYNEVFGVTAPSIANYVFVDWKIGGGSLKGDTSPTGITMAASPMTITLVYGQDGNGDGTEDITVTMEWFDTVLNGKIMLDDTKIVNVGGSFSDPHTLITGYDYKGFRIDGGALQTGDPNILVSAGDVDFTITYVYERGNFMVNVSYEQRNGTAVPGTTPFTRTPGYLTPYSPTPGELAVSNYVLVNWKLDGTSQNNTIPSILVPAQTTAIALVYGRDNGASGDTPGAPGNTADGTEDFDITRSWAMADGAPIATLPDQTLIWNVGSAFTMAHNNGVTIPSNLAYDGYRLSTDNPGDPLHTSAPNYAVNVTDGDVTVMYVYSISAYTVTEHYTDETGADIAVTIPRLINDGDDYLSADYSTPPPRIDDSGKVYVYLGYYTDIAGSLTNLTEDDEVEILTVTAAHDVYFVYHEMSTIVDIRFPASASGMEFYAYPSDAGAVTSPTYEFRNDSEFPVEVSFKGMSVVSPDGVTFVSTASNANEIHLDLALAAPSSGTNGLTSGVNHIVPGDLTTVHAMGTLDGSYLGNSGSDTGCVSIGGQFKGPFPGTARRPELEFNFHFALDMS